MDTLSAALLVVVVLVGPCLKIARFVIETWLAFLAIYGSKKHASRALRVIKARRPLGK
jgi:hypothetical protein